MYLSRHSESMEFDESNGIIKSNNNSHMSDLQFSTNNAKIDCSCCICLFGTELIFGQVWAEKWVILIF